MSHKINDEVVDHFMNWLDDYRAKIEDIFTDDDGENFILVENENGTSGEDGYDVRVERKYVPVQFNNLIEKLA